MLEREGSLFTRVDTIVLSGGGSGTRVDMALCSIAYSSLLRHSKISLMHSAAASLLAFE